MSARCPWRTLIGFLVSSDLSLPPLVMERTFLLDGKALQKLSGDGAVKMHHVTGPCGGDNLYPVAARGVTASIATLANVAFMPILYLVSICSRVSSETSGVECT